LTSSKNLNNQEQLFLWLHFILILVIYAATGYYSPGFDDEYFNLMIVERFGKGVVNFTQSTDVHPPLSYLLNAWLFQLLGSWEWIRMISGIMTGTAILATINRLGKGRDIKFSLILIYLLAFNPAILMWGTSLRWYGYFLPVLIWLMALPSQSRWHWPKFFLSFLWLGYTGYISFFIFPPLFIYYWMKDSREKKEKIKAIIIPGILSALAYLPQLFIFFQIHYPRSGGQVFSLSTGLIGIFSTHVSNQGVFPLSIPGIASALGTGIICIYVLKKTKEEWKSPHLISFGMGQLILLGTRIAGKMRNLSVLLPLQAIWFTERISRSASRWMMIALGLIVFGNLVGTYNVLLHEDTTKNSWNLPVSEVKQLVLQETGSNLSHTLIYCHDPILTWHLEKMGYSVRSPYGHQEIPVKNKNFKKVVVLWTNPGFISKERMNLYHFEIDLIKKSSESLYVLGLDKYAQIKRKKEPQYPDELVSIQIVRDPKQIAEASVWAPIFIRRFN
jgi:hypothetical protein